MVVVERVFERTELGEGPHWDPQTQCLYYVDIFGKAVHKYDPNTQKDTKVTFDENVSFVIPVKNSPNKFLISQKRNIMLMTWDGTSSKVSDMKKIAEVDTEPEVLGNSINDAKCDASGRLWFGTMGEMGKEKTLGVIKPNVSSMYSLDMKNGLKRHVRNITCSNGIAWSSDNKKMYYIDTPTKEIWGFDFDLDAGTISNKEVVFSMNEAGIEGFPDGQTIDSDGNLWVALFFGFKVIQIDPKKKNCLLREVEIPAKQVTSVAFGGKDLDELYVTTAHFETNGEVLPPPNHGALYKVTGLGVKGLPANNATIQ